MSLRLLVHGPVKIYLQKSFTSVSITTVPHEVLLLGSTSKFRCHLVDCLDKVLQCLVAGLFFLLHWVHPSRL